MKFGLALVAVVLTCSGLSLREDKPDPKPSVYRDGHYGFSIEAPRFDQVEKGGKVMPVMLLGPAKNGFSSNVNVVVERTSSTRADYRALSLEAFKGVGFKVISDRDVTVAGRDGIRLEFEGRQQGMDLRFLSLAVIDKDRVILVTCTAPKDLYQSLEARFQSCLESFEIKN